MDGELKADFAKSSNKNLLNIKQLPGIELNWGSIKVSNKIGIKQLFTSKK